MKKYILKYKGLLFVTLLLGAVYSVGSTLVALILKEVIDISLNGNLSGFYSIVLQTIVYFLVLGIFYGVYSTLSKKLVGKVMRMLRIDTFSGVFQKNVSDFKAVNSADYLSALTNDVKNVEDNYFVPLLLCLHQAIVFVTSFVIMLYLSPLVMLCLLVTMLLPAAVPGLFKGMIQRRQNIFSQKQSHMTVAVKDFLSGFEVIRSYRMNDYVEKNFGENNDTVYRSKYSLDKVVAAVEALATVLGAVAQCAVLFVSAFLIINGNITAGSLVGLVQVSGTIVMPIQILAQNIPKIQGSKPIIERLASLASQQTRAFAGTAAPTFHSGLAVKDLHFGYEQDQETIRGIDFTFDKCKKYAVVGKSGCGKTTLINLLTGYYAGYQGEILYDGVDMRGLDMEKLSELSSIIHQNVYMFDESIKDNICLHKKVRERDLQNALQMSGVEMFLSDEKPLETLVGENGSNLSGGQRQRIAVARALVLEKPLLILDEGTSAVDMQTAYDIENQLLDIGDLTLITITHSLNPELLRGYDQIIFMENGRILEAGFFDELVEKEGIFYDFYSLKA